MKFNIAIIGLGRVGSVLLDQLLKLKDKDIVISAVAELTETEGKAKAKEMGLEICTIEKIVEMGETLDIIFEITGNKEVRSQLRNSMRESNNRYTIIASESIVFLISKLVQDMSIPDVHDHKGY